METQLAVYGGIGFGGPTNTLDPSVPTSTPVPVDPSIPTNTPVPVPPGQPTNTSVPLSTNTSAPPATNTPFGAPTATKTPVPSNTVPGAPTATKTLVPTNTPVPTNTNPPPPTNTPAPVCGSITLTGGSGGVFTITNNNFSGVYLEEITLTWDVTANGNWKGTKLEDKNIPTGNNTKSPHTITMSGQPKNFLVEGGNTESLVFEFQNDPPAAGPYSVTIKFSFGSCSKSASAP
jgi:hypothetical protein